MADTQPVVEIYSSMECPYAYLTTFRLRQLWPEYAQRVQFVWRALSLEYVNRQSYPKPLYEAEYELFKRIEPALPWSLWSRPDWQWPVTHWPAFEALACAQAQGGATAFAVSWALREAYFARSACLSLRHEVFAVVERAAQDSLVGQAILDLDRFRSDWDSGRYKAQVVEESRRGWHELKVNGSATLVLPGGQQITNPAVGEIDFDEEHFQLRSFQPHPADPLDVFREILDSL